MKFLGMHLGVIETLITLNVLAFIVELGNSGIVFSLFALQPLTILLKPWSLVTSMFLHAGLIHIFFNMFALYFFGTYLSQIVGEKKLLKAYFIGGIVGSLAYVASAYLIGIPHLESVAVGASGAIFAVAGALAILRPNMKVMMFPIFIPMPLYVAVFVFMIAFSFMPGVAWQGHLGGLLVGVIFGLIWKQKTTEVTAVQGKYGYKFY